MTTDIKKYDFKAGLPTEVELLEIAALYKSNKKIITSNHRAKFYHIIWFQKGSGTHLIDFHTVEIKPNTLLFVNKDVVHRFDPQAEYDGKVILFTDNFFCKTEQDIKYLKNSILFNDLLSVCTVQLEERDIVLTSLFQLFDIEQNIIEDKFHSDILHNYLKSILLLTERERREQGFLEIKKSADLDYVILFKDLLEANFKEQKQVNFYATRIVITEKRLNKATSNVLDKTPKEVIDDRVMLEAKRILAHTTESIKEVGYSLGFDEPTNFIKYFKKHALITPVEFRAKNTLA